MSAQLSLRPALPTLCSSVFRSHRALTESSLLFWEVLFDKPQYSAALIVCHLLPHWLSRSPAPVSPFSRVSHLCLSLLPVTGGLCPPPAGAAPRTSVGVAPVSLLCQAPKSQSGECQSLLCSPFHCGPPSQLSLHAGGFWRTHCSLADPRGTCVCLPRQKLESSRGTSPASPSLRGVPMTQFCPLGC